eukprot:1194611-Prorocentrum_minimum.AAC.3
MHVAFVTQLENSADQALSAAAATTTSIVAAVLIAVLLIYVYMSQVSDRPMNPMRFFRNMFYDPGQRTSGNRGGGEPLMNHRFFHTYRQVLDLLHVFVNITTAKVVRYY